MARSKFQAIRPDAPPATRTVLRVHRRSGEPLYRQVYDRLAEIIASGGLTADARLPSSRSLADQLSLSRATVAYAYDLLSADGLIGGRGQAGTFVLPRAHPRGGRADRPAADPSHAAGSPGSPASPPNPAPLLAAAQLPLELFPRRIWARIVRRQYADLKVDDLRTGDLQGHHRLRRTLSIRLALQRGIVCSPEQVFVTAGLQGAMALITEAVLSAGEAVIVEDPGDPKCREALRRAGARLVPAAVDENGMRVDQALSSAPEARLALVMPSAQFPLGVALSGGRRERLLKWARGSGAWIVERDLHSHFRFAGTPAPALASQDRHGRVLYTIDFSDILFPGLRLGCVVVPPEQVERFRGAVARIALQPGWSDQAALAEFIRFGHIGRYLARSLEVCRRRRQALLEAIAKVSPSTAVYAPDAGLHLLVALDHPLTDASRARLHAFGLAPTPMTTCAPSESAQPTLLVGFGSTPVHAAEHAIAAMLEALRSPPRA